MPETILITGASTGIGRATATLFHERGWNVVATMRNQDNGVIADDRMMISRLDVVDRNTIEDSVSAAIENFGRLDVLVNNAGYGSFGILEAFTPDEIRAQFETNVIGLLSMTQAVLPQMRRQGMGTVINISSIGGLTTQPLSALYNGTKFAVEGLSEALSFELAEVGIRIKLVEPGVIQTDFGGRSLHYRNNKSLVEYQSFIKKALTTLSKVPETGASPRVVAEVIWNAATDGTDTLRYPAGEDAHVLLNDRRRMSDETYLAEIRHRFGL
ncbi:short-chain dehydrogenase protein (plasmid) [Rhizobium gallicum]|uniref:Short-chain dehydrogenase protein n=1 Tax=Rhizobium gallicum TaxID=56730 RepID=A0A1L5NS49_9HYPH|nr:SDR family oxidoreductase [Rhizobium gallicum]APO70714.1 short-chain dehydrogenase protein [Rhizobium gallicum]